MKLKHIQMLSLIFLTTFSLAANEQQESKQIYLSTAEVQEIFANPTRAYVYIGRDISNLADIITEVSKLENDENSPVKALENHIEQGYVIGNYDGVALALEHAEEVMNKIDPEKETELAQALNTIVEQIDEEQLNLDAAMLSAAHIEAPETRACGSCTSHCLRMLVVKEKVTFLNKVKFKDNVTFYDDVKFKNEVIIEDNVVIEGTLSVTDNVIIEGELSVTDLVVLSCMDNLCINTLSVTDSVIIDGTLSVTDNVIIEGTLSVVDSVIIEGTLSVTDLIILSCVDNLCVNTLTVTDIVAPGGSCVDICASSLTVTDIVILSCIDNLCVNNLSTVDGSISTLSTNDIFTDTISSCDVIVGCNILMNSSTSSTIGNIFKGGSSFIHNFGTQNIFAGINSGNFTMTGTGRNTAVGFATLLDNTTGNNNTALGYLALTNNTTGIDNVAVGSTALLANNTGWQNVAVGRASLQANTTGRANTAVGHTTLTVNQTGVFNTALGGSALFVLTSGDSNTALGALAGQTLTTGSNNIYIGASVVGAANESNTTRIGAAQNDTYIDGIFGSSTPAGSRVVVSDSAGKLSTTLTISVTDVIATGDLDLTTNPSTAANGSILKNGSRFLHNAGTNNTFVGVNAGNFTLTGDQNVGVGVSALSGDTTGYENTGVGYRALINNNTGFYNVAVGTDAMFSNSSGNGNTAIGWNAFVNGAGSNNVGVGLGAGTNVGAGSNNIYVGANVLGAAESNTIRIGLQGTQTATFIGGIRGATTGIADAIAVLIDSAGQLGTISSSKRYKHNIQKMDDSSANIYDLNPVTFAYNSDATETTQYGLIAEEVADVFPGIVVNNSDGQPETVQYHVLPVLLVNELKKLAARVAALEAYLAN